MWMDLVNGNINSLRGRYITMYIVPTTEKTLLPRFLWNSEVKASRFQESIGSYWQELIRINSIDSLSRMQMVNDTRDVFSLIQTPLSSDTLHKSEEFFFLNINVMKITISFNLRMFLAVFSSIRFVYFLHKI